MFEVSDFPRENRYMNGLWPAFPELRRFALALKYQIRRPAAQPHAAFACRTVSKPHLGGKSRVAAVHSGLI